MWNSGSHAEERKGVVKRRAKVLKRALLGVLGLLGVLVAVLVVVGLTARSPGEQTVPAGYTRNESLYLTMRRGMAGLDSAVARTRGRW